MVPGLSDADDPAILHSCPHSEDRRKEKKSSIKFGAMNDPPAGPSNGLALIHISHADMSLGPVSLRKWKGLGN